MNKAHALISIVIPAYNEQTTIANIIQRTAKTLQKNGYKHEIIVIDDHSTDRSLETIKNLGAKVYSLKKHMCKGYALRAGFTKAKGQIITTIDSDGSHRPEELPRLLSPILQNQAHIVIGSRYLNQKPAAAKKLNAAGVHLFNFLIQILTGAAVSDSQSGYRAMQAAVLKSLRLESSEYEIESEMLLKATRQGFSVLEVPISFEQRTCGSSRLDPAVDGFKIFLSILLAYIKDG
jgi:glycosyltransferase involved in cell wall biosynthesis